jgi:hypothetical protein
MCVRQAGGGPLIAIRACKVTPCMEEGRLVPRPRFMNVSLPRFHRACPASRDMPNVLDALRTRACSWRVSRPPAGTRSPAPFPPSLRRLPSSFVLCFLRASGAPPACPSPLHCAAFPRRSCSASYALPGPRPPAPPPFTAPLPSSLVSRSSVQRRRAPSARQSQAAPRSFGVSVQAAPRPSGSLMPPGPARPGRTGRVCEPWATRSGGRAPRMSAR